MTAATDEGWIEGSIARLETLEAQREQLAASGQTAALAEIDEEIRALYEVLESVAGEDPEPQASANTGANTGAAAPMGAGMGMAAAPMHAAPMGAGMGMAAAPMQAAAPMGAGMGMGMAGDMGMAPAPTFDMSDDDIKPPRGPLPFILAGLLVIGGGAGAFVMLGKNKPQEAKPAATEPAKIIQAGEVVEDTQEPNVAKGGDADRTRGTNFKESPEDRTAPRRSSGSSSSRPRNTSKKSDDGRKIKVVDSNDPLAGID